MAKFTVLEELDIAIKAAARAADAEKISSRQAGERFEADEPNFIRAFQKEWSIEKVASLIAKERAERRAERNVRRRLGFKRIRNKFELSDGKPFVDGASTLWEHELLLKHLGTLEHPLRAEIIKRRDFLRPYAKLQRGISFNEALKKAGEALK